MPRMTRKQFLAGGAAPLCTGAALQSRRRPRNVLLIMSDQHRPTGLGIEGDPVARTPNLDALARGSVRFGNAYCANPVCLPSRASLLTGLYTHHHGAWNNNTPWPFEIRTMAHHFSRAGYMSALIGKMHFNDAQTHGFDYHLEFNDWFQSLGPKTRLYAEELSRADGGSGLPQNLDLWRDSGDPWNGVREPDGRKGFNHPGRISRIPESQHFESFVTRESVRFLKQHGRRQPFFLIASYLKPHNPFMPAERFAAMFPPERMRLPETWGKVDPAKVPKEIVRMIEHPSATPELRDPAFARIRIGCYWACVAQMDENVGRLLATLRELDIEDDTIVVYTSDHGDMLGEHGLWAKFVFYESSVRVPLFFRVPGLTRQGRRTDTPVSQVQMLATLLELCDLPIPSGLDGESFVRDLRDPEARRDATVFAEFNLRTPNAKYMIRRGTYKYNHYVNDMAELFDLRADPQEMRNLALEPEYRGKAEELRGELFAWYRPPEARG